jgi:hypothetical protein
MSIVAKQGGQVDIVSLEERMEGGSFPSGGFADEVPDFTDEGESCDIYSPEDEAAMEALNSEWERRHLGPTAA